MNFNNKTVWITGASSGIGKALAIAFAKKKSSLIISARREDELEKVKKECLKYCANCVVIPIDLSKRESVNTAFSIFEEHNKTIDILINNGGISQRSLAIETDLEVDKRIMEVNYFGSIQLTKLVAKKMVEQKSGHIVAISSVVGKFGFKLRSAYAASKHALHGFFESLRLELNDSKVNVLLVCPGRIKTDISLHALKADGNENRKEEASLREGMDAEVCAEKIIRAIKQNKKEIYIGGKEVLMVWFKRFFPWLFYKIAFKAKAN